MISTVSPGVCVYHEDPDGWWHCSASRHSCWVCRCATMNVKDLLPTHPRPFITLSNHTTTHTDTVINTSKECLGVTLSESNVHIKTFWQHQLLSLHYTHTEKSGTNSSVCTCNNGSILLILGVVPLLLVHLDQSCHYSWNTCLWLNRHNIRHWTNAHHMITCYIRRLPLNKNWIPFLSMEPVTVNSPLELYLHTCR